MIGFELPQFRPPSEAFSLLVRATKNCPWNRCAFCAMYKGKKFELRTVEDVKLDIWSLRSLADQVRDWAERTGCGGQAGQVARASGILWMDDDGEVRRAFIGDSNSLIMKTDQLVEIIEYLYEAFPSLERVTSYARAKTALKKRPEELARLKTAGLSRLHLGLETGDDELLAYMEKGATAEEMVEAGRKVKEAGISVSEYVILGLGGHDRWLQHALGTARVLNAVNPDFIRVRTLNILPQAPLWERRQRGEFSPTSPEEILQEEKTLIENLEVKSQFVSDHVSNFLPLDGQLPQDKERLLREIERVLEQPDIMARMSRWAGFGNL